MRAVEKPVIPFLTVVTALMKEGDRRMQRDPPRGLYKSRGLRRHTCPGTARCNCVPL